MKKIEVITKCKWRPDIEERLGIENKPFIRVKFNSEPYEDYYLYRGVSNNELILLYRSKNAHIASIKITPELLADGLIEIYSNESEDKLIPIPSEDLIETAIVEMDFKKEIPYKIVSRYDGMIYYGFFIATKSGFASFYCFSEHVLSKLFTKSFSIDSFDFYELE